MKKVNFAVEVLGIDGQPIMDENGNFVKISKHLANAMVQIKATDSIRNNDVAKDIYYSEGEMNVEEADFAMIEKAIPQIGFTSLMEGQLKKIMKKAKEKKKKEIDL